MTTIVTIGTQILAIGDDTPTDTERGLLFDGLTYSALTLADVSVYQAAPPEDYAPGKYLYDGSAFTPNPAYIEPTPPSQPDAIPAPPLTKIDILKRITADEWKLFEDSTDKDVRYAKAVFDSTTEIHRDDPLTVALFPMLEAKGVLASGRAAEILA